jgi:hypothetical protein
MNPPPEVLPSSSPASVRQSLRLIHSYEVPKEPFFWDGYHYCKYHFALYCQEYAGWDAFLTPKVIEMCLIVILLSAPFILLSVSLDKMMQWAFLTTIIEVWTIARIHSLKTPCTGTSI